jgi:hypothetical protein
MNRERLTPLTGVAFVLLAIVALVIAGEPPEASSAAREIVDHYVDNKDSIVAGSLIAGLALIALIFFAGHLRKVLDAADKDASALPSLVLAGASVMAVGIALDSTILLGLAESAEDIDPSAVQALQALWDNDFIPIAVGTVVFLLSAGISVVRTGALPRWLGWIAIVLAIIGVTPAGFVAFLGGGLWILVVSVLLSMRARSAPAA